MDDVNDDDDKLLVESEEEELEVTLEKVPLEEVDEVVDVAFSSASSAAS